MRCPPQEHGSASGRPSARRGGPDVGMPVVAWSPCPHPRSASTRPVSDVRSCDVRASGAQCPGVRVSGCPLSGVSGVGVRAFRVPVRVRCVRTGAFVERVGASGSHMAEPAQAVLGQRRRRAGPGRRRGGARAADRVRSHGRPGTAGCAGSPVGLEAGRRGAPQAVAWLRAGGQGKVGGRRPTMTWAGRRRRPRVGSGGGPGPWGRPLRQGPGWTGAEGVRPHHGPSGQGARPGWARQLSELGE
jgi:hypothetical protein